MLAKSNRTGELVAIKQINYSNFKSKEKELLCSEVNISKELHHFNIVRYIDKYIDKTRGILYIVMEYCDNSDLQHYIKRHKNERRYISEDKIWSVAYQLLSVLDYCHRTCKPGQIILHRDLKPANIYLTREGSIKVGDFGLSKLVDISAQARTNVGTPLYMSPQLLQHLSYSEKVDIWAAGCIIYELASLQPPYVATNIESLKLKVRAGTRPSLPSMYSYELKVFIDQMLTMTEERRPSAQTLLQNPKLVEMGDRLTPNPQQHAAQQQPQVETFQQKQERLAKKEMELNAREQKLMKAQQELRKYGCF